MQRQPELIDRSAEEGARVVALALLSDADEAARALERRDDEEALHDFRVGLRRLRSALRAFRPWLAQGVPRKQRSPKAASPGASRSCPRGAGGSPRSDCRRALRTRPGPTGSPRSSSARSRTSPSSSSALDMTGCSECPGPSQARGTRAARGATTEPTRRAGEGGATKRCGAGRTPRRRDDRLERRQTVRDGAGVPGASPWASGAGSAALVASTRDPGPTTSRVPRQLTSRRTSP
jgi:CHAD domain-containing protein